MRGLAAAYAAGLPGRDTHALPQGLCDVSLRFMPLGWRDGAYDPEHRVILINSQSKPERQRFTLAHEISHAILLGDDDLLSDLHDAYEGDKLEQVIETLCNVGAAEILMPREMVQEVIATYGPTGEALARLARRAEVSVSSALYALAEQTEEPTLYAVCAVARTREEEGGGKALSVRASSASPGVKYSLGVGTPIPPEHPVAAALESGVKVEEKSFVPFRSGRQMSAYVVAYPVRYVVGVSFRLPAGVLGREGAPKAEAQTQQPHRQAEGQREAASPPLPDAPA